MTIKAQVQQIAIEDIKKGDIFIGMPHGRPAWTALSDIEKLPNGNFTLHVQHHPDGGTGYREWTSLSARMMLPIARSDGEVST